MTAMQLFESLQYLDDELLAAPARSAAPIRRWPLWAAAACLALAVIFPAVLSGPRPGTETAHTDPAPRSETPRAVAGGAATRPVVPVGVPGGVPGPDAAEAAAPKPTVLAWNERESALGAEMYVYLTSEPLTAAQMAEYGPEIRMEWMADAEGFAVYYGWGELAWAELLFSDPAWDGTITLRLRDAAAQPIPSFGPEPEKTDTVGALNGQEYRAYRYAYTERDGTPWAELSVVFERNGVAYAMCTTAPQSAEEAAALDLADLLLAYAGTHSTPDLNLSMP